MLLGLIRDRKTSIESSDLAHSERFSTNGAILPGSAPLLHTSLMEVVPTVTGQGSDHCLLGEIFHTNYALGVFSMEPVGLKYPAKHGRRSLVVMLSTLSKCFRMRTIVDGVWVPMVPTEKTKGLATAK